MYHYSGTGDSEGRSRVAERGRHCETRNCLCRVNCTVSVMYRPTNKNIDAVGVSFHSQCVEC
eukprot:1877368-Prymnesium_polylepis.1